MDELLARIERLAQAERAGELVATGKWTAAQIFWHLGRFIEFSLDGFPFQYPARYRWAARALALVSRELLLKLAFRPGFNNPPAAALVEPAPSLALDESLEYLRRQCERVRRGERMIQPSPTGEAMTHEQWLLAHRRHFDLHLGFLKHAPPRSSGGPR